MVIENQTIINLVDDTLNQPPKLKTKISIEINDKSQGTYN